MSGIKIAKITGILGVVLIFSFFVFACDGGDGGGGNDSDNDLNTYYEDSDSDGYGDPNSTTQASSQPTGYVSDNTDCDDTNQNVHPGEDELCDDNIDNDCDGDTDCEDGDCDDETACADVEELTFFEEEVSGKWYRYHSYSGSSQYIILYNDRTGCKWEEDSGSNRRESVSNYVHWELTDIGSNVFRIDYKTSPTGSLFGIDEYRYATDVIWRGGYSNLVMRRSTTTKECE